MFSFQSGLIDDVFFLNEEKLLFGESNGLGRFVDNELGV